MIGGGGCSGSLQKGWNRVANAVVAGLPVFRRRRPEIVAREAVAHVELVADDREQHGMRAEKQEAVRDGVQPDVGWDLRRSAAVPTRAVPRFSRVGRGVHLACCGTYPGGSAALSPKKKSSMCLATRSCASFCHGMSRYSLRIIFMRSSQSFHASTDTFSKMRWPSSPGQGGASRPGSSFWNFTHMTLRP